MHGEPDAYLPRRFRLASRISRPFEFRVCLDGVSVYEVRLDASQQVPGVPRPKIQQDTYDRDANLRFSSYPCRTPRDCHGMHTAGFGVRARGQAGTSTSRVFPSRRTG